MHLCTLINETLPYMANATDSELKPIPHLQKTEWMNKDIRKAQQLDNIQNILLKLIETLLSHLCKRKNKCKI